MAVAAHVSVLSLTLWIAGGAVLIAIIAGFTGRWLVSRGLREPFVVRRINRVSDRVVDAVKKPITIAVLDEVASVLQTGHYTRNIASALRENQEELKQMVADTLREDPTAGRLYRLPFHDRLIDEVTETTLRVIFRFLADPRTDELISDLLRDNINQIRQAIREQDD